MAEIFVTVLVVYLISILFNILFVILFEKKIKQYYGHFITDNAIVTCSISGFLFLPLLIGYIAYFYLSNPSYILFADSDQGVFQRYYFIPKYRNKESFSFSVGTTWKNKIYVAIEEEDWTYQSAKYWDKTQILNENQRKILKRILVMFPQSVKEPSRYDRKFIATFSLEDSYKILQGLK